MLLRRDVRFRDLSAVGGLALVGQRELHHTEALDPWDPLGKARYNRVPKVWSVRDRIPSVIYDDR